MEVWFHVSLLYHSGSFLVTSDSQHIFSLQSKNLFISPNWSKMSGVSDEELPRSTRESELELSSELSVETCDSDFIPYDKSLEPFATEHKVAKYEEQVAQEEEEEEEQMLLSRFSGEVDVRIWYVHVVFCGCMFFPRCF